MKSIGKLIRLIIYIVCGIALVAGIIVLSLGLSGGDTIPQKTALTNALLGTPKNKEVYDYFVANKLTNSWSDIQKVVDHFSMKDVHNFFQQLDNDAMEVLNPGIESWSSQAEFHIGGTIAGAVLIPVSVVASAITLGVGKVLSKKSN